MKKITLISLLVFLLLVFNITQASAGCNIVWSGDRSGSVPTNETSRTQQAAQELYIKIEPYISINCNCGDNTTPSFIDNCYGYSYSNYPYCSSGRKTCTNGTWSSYCSAGRDLCEVFCTIYNGTWDVICDASTTTTTVQQTTTTTTAPATLINLASFTATPKFSKVIIQWDTESEIDNAGFNIYRSESENGEYTKINAALIPAQGSSTQGASYEFIDNDVQNRITYYYKLEDIDLNGTSTMHGPVSATPRWIFGFGK